MKWDGTGGGSDVDEERGDEKDEKKDLEERRIRTETNAPRIESMDAKKIDISRKNKIHKNTSDSITNEEPRENFPE